MRSGSLVESIVNELNTELETKRAQLVESVRRAEERLSQIDSVKAVAKKNSVQEVMKDESKLTPKYFMDRKMALDNAIKKCAKESGVEEVRVQLHVANEAYKGAVEKYKKVITGDQLNEYMKGSVKKEGSEKIHRKAAVKVQAKLNVLSRGTLEQNYQACKDMIDNQLSQYQRFNNSITSPLFAMVETAPELMKKNQEAIITSLLNPARLTTANPDFTEIDAKIADAKKISDRMVNQLINAFDDIKQYADIQQRIVAPLQAKIDKVREMLLSELPTLTMDKQGEASIKRFNELATALYIPPGKFNNDQIDAVIKEMTDQRAKDGITTEPTPSEIRQNLSAKLKECVAEMERISHDFDAPEVAEVQEEKHEADKVEVEESEVGGPDFHSDPEEQLSGMFDYDLADEGAYTEESVAQNTLAQDIAAEASQDEQEIVAPRMHH